MPEFRKRLHREVIDETYPKLHELLHPLSDNDIDKAIQNWNGNIESKHAVVRYMKDHAREKDTAAWLAQEYGGSNSLFVVRAGSPEETQLPWPKVQRRIAQLIQEDRFYTEEEQDRFDNIDPRQGSGQSSFHPPYPSIQESALSDGYSAELDFCSNQPAEPIFHRLSTSSQLGTKLNQLALPDVS